MEKKLSETLKKLAITKNIKVDTVFELHQTLMKKQIVPIVTYRPETFEFTGVVYTSDQVITLTGYYKSYLNALNNLLKIGLNEIK